MSNDYKSLSTSDLIRKWERERDRIAGKKPSERMIDELDELMALRREIDRRRGVRNPTVLVNFEDYVKE